MSSISSDSTGRSEHLKLAGIVKAVHAKLRRKYKKDRDFDELWAEHVRNKDLLSEYADAMHHLAVNHWSKHPETRIDWCRSVCLRYFIYGELQKVLDKDARKKAFEDKKDKDGNKHSPAKDATEHLGEFACNGSSQISDTQVVYDSENNCNGINDQTVLQTDAQSDLENSFDEVQDAGDLMKEKCNLNAACQHTEGKESPNPVLIDHDEKQPAESKCKEYLGRLADSLDQGENLQGIGDNGQEHLDQDAVYSKYGPANYTTITVPVKGKLRLLDVGSCYNPFLQFEEFVAIGVDISPAVESVFSCDFLHLEMQEPLQLAQDTHDSWLAGLRSPITRLPKDCFHVVVFSLLLEYFPSAYQRWLCCQKAHELLMMNGLLLIITPDSHHVNRGAPQMKSWKLVLESLGFRRYKYEKQDHLHCMAYRKVVPVAATPLLNGITPDMLYIPQDFNNADNLEDDFPAESRTQFEDDKLCENFMELPEFDIF